MNPDEVQTNKTAGASVHVEAGGDENWVVTEANKQPLRLPLGVEEHLAAAIMLVLGLILNPAVTPPS